MQEQNQLTPRFPETDSLEFSPLINDFEAACAFRRETMAYIEATLQKERTVDLDSISTNRIITNFKPVGEAIAKNCNQRKHPRPNQPREAHHQLTPLPQNRPD